MHRTCRIPDLFFVVLSCFAVAGLGQQTSPALSSGQSVQTQPNGAAQSQEANETLSPESQNRLIKEVRHELIMLPYYGVFDNLAFRIDGRTVILEGQVVNPVTKSGAENPLSTLKAWRRWSTTLRCFRPTHGRPHQLAPFTKYLQLRAAL